jgi:hypothetical protein
MTLEDFYTKADEGGSRAGAAMIELSTFTKSAGRAKSLSMILTAMEKPGGWPAVMEPLP